MKNNETLIQIQANFRKITRTLSIRQTFVQGEVIEIASVLIVRYLCIFFIGLKLYIIFTFTHRRT